MVVTLKYVIVIMRADNDGEGGIMALTALAQRSLPRARGSAYVVGILGIFGASLFFGDGMITPPITVLGAVEGLEVVSPVLAQLHGADQPGDADRPVRRPALRHREGGQGVRPGDDAWFMVLAALRHLQHRGNPIVLRRSIRWWAALLRRARLARGADPGRGGAGRHRRRGAVRRHGPFRRASRSAGAGSVSCCRRWC
jgi:KUP system potassium uptake protein